jgi:hypothetical protein
MENTRIEVNELGQKVIYLSQKDWEEYGKQAGYFPEITKEASNEQHKETVEEQSTVDAYNLKLAELSEEVAKLKAELAERDTVKESSTNSTLDNTVLLKENSDFNEENYPNLVAEQDQEGLIGPFAPRK